MKTGFLFLLAAGALAAADTHRVVGAEYYHTFSAKHPILKKVRPGDRVVTKTVDSAGFDFQGVRRTKTHGNPLTGAFFVEGAEPGDAVAVSIDKLQLNRASGYTGYMAAAKDLPKELTVEKPGLGAMYPGYDYLFPWVIDLKKKTVRPKNATGAKTHIEYAAQPMLGCIGVAPVGDYSPRSGPSGPWGGNMDYNWIRQGTTVYLPVYHPGGLVFFGDGHALQGDGEAVGAGIETSLDVEVSLNVRKAWKIERPRAETADWLIAIGAKENTSIEDRLHLANADMLAWLVNDYHLPAWEAHQIIGMQARYDFLSFAGAVALRIPKAALRAK